MFTFGSKTLGKQATEEKQSHRNQKVCFREVRSGLWERNSSGHESDSWLSQQKAIGQIWETGAIYQK